MIRFVDMRRQGTGSRFAFFDTIRDQFCTIGGDQAWEDEADFVESFTTGGGYGPSDIDRFLALIPEWAKTPAKVEFVLVPTELLMRAIECAEFHEDDHDECGELARSVIKDMGALIK